MKAEEIREKLIEELDSDLESDFITEKTKEEYLKHFDNWVKNKAKDGDEYFYAGNYYKYTEDKDISYSADDEEIDEEDEREY